MAYISERADYRWWKTVVNEKWHPNDNGKKSERNRDCIYKNSNSTCIHYVANFLYMF